MDTSLEYRLMCLNLPKLQEEWNPKMGDYMIAKASYCHDNGCSVDAPCERCLGNSNTYVISGQFDFHESVGGTKWYYGGHSCVRGMGCRMNSTSCFVMTKKFMDYGDNDFNTRSYHDMLWLPRQDQIQDRINRKNVCVDELLDAFMYWLEGAVYHRYNVTFEQLWLMYLAETKYKKCWDYVNKKWNVVKKYN